MQGKSLTFFYLSGPESHKKLLLGTREIAGAVLTLLSITPETEKGKKMGWRESTAGKALCMGTPWV